MGFQAAAREELGVQRIQGKQPFYPAVGRLLTATLQVMAYSVGCKTPLSNFEASQNYKDVSDPSGQLHALQVLGLSLSYVVVIVTFPLVDEPQVSLLAWTTTPWTLPSNLFVITNPDFIYLKIKDNESGRIYILAECRLSMLYKNTEPGKEYVVLGKMKGADLKGKSYEPLFPYFGHLKTKGFFVVLCDTYVKDDAGTGVVHSAPGFGEDDLRVAQASGIFKKDDDVVCPVSPSGHFTAEVTDFAGQYFKDADKEIIKVLKLRGKLIHHSTIVHSYPHCWRSDTPLMYRAVPSWFVRVETMNERLLAHNDKTNWVPSFVKEKRFHNWLRDARDWAISRSRYWGTPIPIWMSEDGEEVVCVGSTAELKELSGVTVTDLHREVFDLFLLSKWLN